MIALAPTMNAPTARSESHGCSIPLTDAAKAAKMAPPPSVASHKATPLATRRTNQVSARRINAAMSLGTRARHDRDLHTRRFDRHSDPHGKSLLRLHP